MLNIIFKKTKKIPFSIIRHNDAFCYKKEGFGGQPIEKWPVYDFLSEYLFGDALKAKSDFENWYLDQLNKYQNISNEKGGMKNGSLYKHIENYWQKPISELNDFQKREATSKRIDKRFKLLDNIKNQGYDKNTEVIEAIYKNGLVYLKAGHHRAAILKVLGEDKLPGVLVFPNVFVYNLFCFLRKIKNVIFRKKG